MENLNTIQTFYILLDDDECVHVNWKFTGKDRGITVKPYLTSQELLQELHLYPKDTEIYIDSNLSHGQKGEEFAKILWEMGFRNIYLTTGSSPTDFPNMPWIKKIVGKNPPWLTE